MHIIQRHLQSFQANSSFKDNPRLLSKCTFCKFCFWLQWLQLQWKNVWQNISSSRLRMVSLIHFSTFNVSIDNSKIDMMCNRGIISIVTILFLFRNSWKKRFNVQCTCNKRLQQMEWVLGKLWLWVYAEGLRWKKGKEKLPSTEKQLWRYSYYSLKYIFLYSLILVVSMICIISLSSPSNYRFRLQVQKWLLLSTFSQ